MGKRKRDQVESTATTDIKAEPSAADDSNIDKKKKKKSKSKKASRSKKTKKEIAVEVVPPIERAGLPKNMTLFNITNEVLLIIIGFLTWDDIAILISSYQGHPRDLDELGKLLVRRMNREFASGLAVLMKRTKNKVTSYTVDDVDWLFAQLDGRETLSQSVANREYSVPISKLQTLRCQLVRNPHYRNAAPMRLYDLWDVIHLCLDRFGNVERFEEYQSKLADRPASRHEKRTKMLETALAEFGLKIRSDSALCSQFLSCKIAASRIDWVVRKMCEMKYCHEYSKEFKANYEKIQEEREQDLEYLQNNWDESYAHEDYHEMWDGESMTDRAAVGIKFPEVWPWLRSSSV